MPERDEREFDRTGVFNYMRAFDEGAALWSAVQAAEALQGLDQRVHAAAVKHLGRYRPDAMGVRSSWMVAAASIQGCWRTY